jgi:uncharacterized protein (TIGR03067 family)
MTKKGVTVICAACLVVAASGPEQALGQTKGQNRSGSAGSTTAKKAIGHETELLGRWDGVKSEFDGREPVERADITASFAVFTKDGVTVTIKGEKFGPYPYRVNPNPLVKPRQIDFDVKDDKGVMHSVLGIYRVQGDQLTICVRENTRPASFPTYAGSKTWLSILRRRSR